MNTTIFKDLFNFKIKEQLKISVTNNELYYQLILYIFSMLKNDLLILTSNLNETSKIYSNLKNYINELYIFPEDDYLTKKAIAASPELLFMRLKFLNNIEYNNKKIIICHLNSFLKKLPSYSSFKNKSIKLKKDQKINRNELVKNIDNIGYRKDYLVTNVGDYSTRGFVIDIYPIYTKQPIRIEFFGDIIENIKYFDENTQRSTEDINEVEIKPIVDDFNSNESSILEYLNNPYIIIQDINQIKLVQKNIKAQMDYYEEKNNIRFDFNESKLNNKIYIDLINNVGKYDYVFNSKDNKIYNENINELIEDINKEKKPILVTKNKNLINKIKEKVKVKIIEEYLNKGFKYNSISYYSENDLKKSVFSNDYSNYKFGKKINSLEKLKVGDYVVHKNNGIGVYMGIKTILRGNTKKDYILIKYKGNDKLYMPVENIDKLYKYSSKEGTKPIIHKLNSLEWKKTKIKIKSRIKNITDELIKIYKNRQTAIIEPFEKDNEMQQIFESEFVYEETLDQLKATGEIKNDLESGKPMDRLLCGDVGYGKTEVIFRSIFKTVMNNKQVMYLCPTTILSYQQFYSAKERFKNFAVNIELINRNTTKKEVKSIITRLHEGKIDVIFGTHRLLSNDIKFLDLALLVIDEEHRFGVEQKEKLKKIKSNVHVLGVSATPIPRSLQMSLVGIRDLSLIDTPPKKRYPVQTYVINYNELLLREAVIKELNRNGQVFILYNRIENIDIVSHKYSQLIPEADIKYVHGKTNKDEMQEILLKFMNNEFNVLVSTTIIENGIDIPNANTIIIIDSDKFGLSQLYQIRGRVGRSDKIAYAYLMYNKSKILTDAAAKRLDAIKEFTELGSGYKISLRDLSIRGAGDILGKEQAGFIDSVGMDMYLELINEGINNIAEDAEENTNLINDISTHIDQNYSSDDEIIIDLHKKIKNISNEESIIELEKEIKDRFGILDENIELYMYQTLFEKILEKNDISVFENNKIKCSIRLNDEVIKKLVIDDLFINSSKINSKFKFIYKNKYLLISLTKSNLKKHYIYYLLDLIKYINKKINSN